jgi:hypothetical protein
MIRLVPDALRYTDQGDPAAPLLRVVDDPDLSEQIMTQAAVVLKRRIPN